MVVSVAPAAREVKRAREREGSRERGGSEGEREGRMQVGLRQDRASAREPPRQLGSHSPVTSTSASTPTLAADSVYTSLRSHSRCLRLALARSRFEKSSVVLVLVLSYFFFVLFCPFLVVRFLSSSCTIFERDVASEDIASAYGAL